MSKLDELIKNYKIEFEKFNNFRKTFFEERKTLFAEAAKEFFVKYPEVEAIYRYQYIPGFNDGEPCRFTTGSIYVSNDQEFIKEYAKTEDPSDDQNIWVIDCEYNRKIPNLPFDATKEENIKSDAYMLFDIIDDGIDEKMFGSNAEIVITKEGIVSEDYDCGY